MIRKIYCAECTTYLGEIRDATLKKGMIYLCIKCEETRNLLKATIGRKGNNPVMDMFTDIFDKPLK